jgi:GDP-L-fucose synthase
MNKNDRIYVAGQGLVGSAIIRKLKSLGFTNIITRRSKELDLTDQKQTLWFFLKESIDYVFLAAAKVGGINANNTYPAEFIYNNLTIQSNVIHSAWLSGVKKLLFLGSSCIYSKNCPDPIKEEYLLSGYLEKTNEPYAIAKIAGIKMCESYNRQYKTNFITAMPTNLYGLNDSYDLENSHVLPAIIRKIHQAKIDNSPICTLWGTGNPRREFLNSDDVADACIFLMENYNENAPINVGTGEDITIKELAYLIKDIVSYEGEIEFDSSKPDGTMRKRLDVSKINNLGWKYKIGLREGIENTYEDYEYSILDATK